MTLLAHLVLALAFAVVVRPASGCTETGTCALEKAVEDVHEVSMLQTDIHVQKGPGMVQKTAPALNQVDGKASRAARGWWAEQSERMHRADEQIALNSKLAKVTAGEGEGQITLGLALTWCSVIATLLGLAGIFHYIWEKESENQSKYVAEFVGTFMLVLSVGCNVLVGDATWGVTSIACTLMVMIYALGGVSGANFNPAVSVGLGLAKKMAWDDVAIYVCVQLAAGISAGLSYGSLLGKTFNLAPKGTHSWVEAGFAELLYTFMLVFVVLNTAASKKHAGQNQFYGLAIGFSVVAGGYGAGSISGGCFNPAVALGIDSSSSHLGFGMCFTYFVFEIIGCALAAAVFSVCRPEDFDSESSEEYEATLRGKLTSEFVGTYMLVLTVGLNVLNDSKAGAFSIAASLMCMIFALGSCSGAHFNPAVTMAILCSKRGIISTVDALFYMCAQILGGIFAAFTYMMMMNGQTVPLAPKASATQALLGEFAFTFLLCFVVLSVATTQKALSEYFGLAIGACVIAGGYAIGGLSGGSLNPAVSAGLAISDLANGGHLTHLVSYASAEFFGGIVAAAVFGVTHAQEYVIKAAS